MEKEKVLIQKALQYAKASSKIENLDPTQEEVKIIKKVLMDSTKKTKQKGRKK